VPAAVRQLSVGRALRVVWENEAGGLTFESSEGEDRRFVKWTPAGSGIDLATEILRLRWAERFVDVPRVLDHGSDSSGSWLVTAALPGENAVTARWKADPERAVAAIGRGLRAFHDTLPRESCPFGWSRTDRLAEVEQRAANGLHDPSRWHKEHRGLTIEEALAALREVPGTDDLVVCHGDACAPNTLLADDGHVTGHVDLGALGLADRWADLAIATWSTAWNYGWGLERRLLDAYGIEADPIKIAYYRLLYDLGP
jgi:aminoglycoside phosphotransferase